jgi:hypothetical protein
MYLSFAFTCNCANRAFLETVCPVLLTGNRRTVTPCLCNGHEDHTDKASHLIFILNYKEEIEKEAVKIRNRNVD